jgi:hypothetical protein
VRALLMVLWLASAQAQQLDLTLRPVTEGTVTSVREVGGAKKVAPPSAAQSLGTPTEIEESPPVGAVLYLPFGGSSGPAGDKKWRLGAAGTPEMQQQLARTSYEVVVKMEDGEQRLFKLPDGQRFRVGQRVTLRSGTLEPA